MEINSKFKVTQAKKLREMGDCSISSANALEILQSCTKPLIYGMQMYSQMIFHDLPMRVSYGVSFVVVHSLIYARFHLFMLLLSCKFIVLCHDSKWYCLYYHALAEWSHVFVMIDHFSRFLFLLFLPNFLLVIAACDCFSPGFSIHIVNWCRVASSNYRSF